jgi:hypothetical protein
MAFQIPLGWCGSHPFILPKRACLQSRGFLNPATWHELHLLACDPKAVVSRVSGHASQRAEVSSNGVITVIVDHLNTGLAVILTAFVPANPQFPAGTVKMAASKIDPATVVDLNDRLWGRA